MLDFKSDIKKMQCKYLVIDIHISEKVYLGFAIYEVHLSDLFANCVYHF